MMKCLDGEAVLETVETVGEQEELLGESSVGVCLLSSPFFSAAVFGGSLAVAGGSTF